MKTTCTNAAADQRVEGDMADVASQTGRPAPKLGGDPRDIVGTLDFPQEIEESALAISMDDDDISPDDAPEIMFEEDDEEVRAFITIGAIKHPY